MAVAQALLGFTSEARRLRFLPARMPGAFRYLPGQSGYNRRLRAALPLVKHVMRWLAADTDLWTGTTWIVDSTPVERGRSRPTVKRSQLAAWAKYSFCRSHSRWSGDCVRIWPAPPPGYPSAGRWPIRRSTSGRCSCHLRPRTPSAHRTPGLLIIADKGYVSRELDRFLDERGVRLIRRITRLGELPREGTASRAGACERPRPVSRRAGRRPLATVPGLVGRGITPRRPGPGRRPPVRSPLARCREVRRSPPSSPVAGRGGPCAGRPS